jgi:vitamin B12 transporter
MSYLILVLLSASTFASRLDPVIVSSKSNNQSSEFTAPHSVLSPVEIDSNVTTDTIDLLQSIPGVFVSRTGGAGSQISINIRGGDSGHVLVLIDGVNVNDPSEGSRKFNMPALKSLDIEKIEVLKGAQSVLYGSHALGGVINIITKKAQGKSSVILDYGQERGISNSLTYYGKKSVFYMNAFYNESEGISAQKAGSEKDGNTNKGATLNYSYSFDKFDMDWQYKVLDSFVETDGFGSDDLGAYNKQIQQIISQKISANHGKNLINQKISFNKSDRYNKYDNSGYKVDNYSGTSLDNDIHYIFNLKNKKILMGISNQNETFTKSSVEQVKSSINAVYMGADFKNDDLFYSFGLRNDGHSDFGNYATYSVGMGKNLEKRRQLKLHYATGFKAPTMYQLYVEKDGVYTPGNRNLRPETSRSIDLTFKQMGVNSYSISIFDTLIDDIISFSGSVGPYINSGTSRSYGSEFSASQKISNKLSLNESVSFYKYENSKSKYTLKRPTEQISLGGDFKFSDSARLSVDWSYISSRWAFGNKLMKAYDLTNISYKKDWELYFFKFGIKNLFDREYTEAQGYGTYGMTVYTQFAFNY